MHSHIDWKCGNEKCQRPLVSTPAWRAMTVPERRSSGFSQHGGHGFCRSCYVKRSRLGVLPTRPSKPQFSRAEVLEEWEHQRQSGVPIKRQVRVLAPRMGMTFEALERALYRAGVRSELDPMRGNHYRKNGSRA